MNNGKTLRDEFAIAYALAILQNNAWYETNGYTTIEEDSYKFADEMLKQRKK